MKKGLLLTVAACSLFSVSANAKIWRPYIGVDYSYIDAKYESPYDRQLAQEFNSVTGSVGIKLTTNLAVEGFYQQSLGSENNTAHNTQLINDGTDSSIKIKAYGVDLVSDFINLDMVEILTSVGIGQYKADVNRNYYYGGKMMNVTNSFDGTGVRFGVGAQVNITDSLGVRAMGRYVLTDVEAIKSIKEFTVGLRYTF